MDMEFDHTIGVMGQGGMPPTAVVNTGKYQHLGFGLEWVGMHTCTWTVLCICLCRKTMGARLEVPAYQVGVMGNHEVCLVLGQSQCVATYSAQMLMQNLEGVL